MNHIDKLKFIVLCTLSLLAVFLFGVYWFDPARIPNNFYGWQHTFDLLLFATVTYVVWMPIIMKVALWAITSHAKNLPYTTPQTGLRVAMITTFVPGSESASLLHKTLPAMRAVKYEHDTWLLDEGDDEEAKEICKQYGVNHFSRSGMEYYNTIDGKFARKTKGGNHNSWYDSVGNEYDIVAQMDTDFIPRDDFLLKTLGHFRDPRVAFVGTPQIYGNIDESLIARGAAQQTYSFYGPLLRGMAGMDTTMLIGANHIIRVAALKDVDHYTAHITEDLLTGMKLHANKWRSIYVPEPLAIGEGPDTWKSYFAQQKRWAYGCMHILMNHSFRLFRSMTMRRSVYYFLIQQHYFGGIAMFLSICCLILYFTFGFQTTKVQLGLFLSLYLSVIILTAYMNRWLQRLNIRPQQERGVMWAGMYIGVVAWPIYLMAFFSLFHPKKMIYKVTPKGVKVKSKSTPNHLFIPHLVLATIAFACLASSFYTGRNSIVMQFWAVICGIFLLIVPIIPMIIALYDRNFQRLRSLSARIRAGVAQANN